MLEAYAYHLAKELSGRLDSSPSRDIFALDDFGAWRCHLLNEAFVGDDATVQIDLCAM